MQTVPEISSLSTEPLRVGVRGRSQGAVVNPTIGPDVVKLAFLVGKIKPIVGDWRAATWDTDTGPTYSAELLIGPSGAVVLAPGHYTVWIQHTHGTATIVRRVGAILIT